MVYEPSGCAAGNLSGPARSLRGAKLAAAAALAEAVQVRLERLKHLLNIFCVVLFVGLLARLFTCIILTWRPAQNQLATHTNKHFTHNKLHTKTHTHPHAHLQNIFKRGPLCRVICHGGLRQQPDAFWGVLCKLQRAAVDAHGVDDCGMPHARPGPANVCVVNHVVSDALCVMHKLALCVMLKMA